MGGLALLGWMIGTEAFINVLPGLTTLKPSSAACFVLAAISLYLIQLRRGELSNSRNRRTYAARVLSVAVGLVGLLTLVEYIFGLSLGIGAAWFSRTLLADPTAQADRMAGATALGFLLLSVSAFFATTRYAHLAQSFGFLTSLGGFVACVAYFLGMGPFLLASAYSSMALPIATLFLLAGLAILAARPRTGLMAVVTSVDLGGVMVRRLLPPIIAIVIVIFLGWLRWQGQVVGPHGTGFVLAILMVSEVVALIALLWTSALRLNRIDQERRWAQQQQLRLAAIVESSNDAIFSKDLSGTIMSWNRGAERLYGYSASEMIGQPVANLIPPELQEEASQILREIARGHSVMREETIRLRKDGSPVNVSLVVSPMLDLEGQIVGASSIAHDITARRKIENQLHLHATALAAAANAILITDAAGQIVWVNPAFTKLTGYELGEVMGQTPRILKSGHHDRAFYEQMWKTVLRGQVWHGEMVNRRKDGSLYTEEMTITPVLDENGVMQNFVAIKQDITARKSLEEQLRQSHKMEAVGQLAGGIAHDFNNLLQVIIIHCQFLADELGTDNRVELSVDEIQKASYHAAQLVSQLLAFSRKQVLQPRVLDLGSIVSEADTMLRRLIREDIELSTVLATDLGRVRVDPTQIMQALLNLATNARDAMPYGGTLKIETRNVTWLADETHSTLAMPAGHYVLLQVKDTGIGMDEKTKARIFEPFFTTKGIAGAGTGTGLGLASVHGIVRQSAGYISVESQIGRGTTFKIYLPRVDEDDTDSANLTRERESPREWTATVLAVEDSDLIRLMLPKVLENANCKVLLASNGVEALAAAERYQGPIHLLITDVMMPGLSGPELAAQLGAARPEMKVLYMSGYSSEILAKQPLLTAGCKFLQKPFKPQDLLRGIKELLPSATATAAEPIRPPAAPPRQQTN
jgi:PAS domain S-box-containing protein